MIMKRNKNNDRDLVLITVLMIIGMLSLCYGIYKLVKGTSGSPCAVEVQFSGSKATYIGTSI